MKRVVVFAFILVCGLSLFAFESTASLFANLSSDDFETLMSGEVIAHEYELTSDYYCSDSIMFDRCEKDLSNGDSWSVGLTCFIRYPEYMEGMSDEEKLIHVYNTMKAVSTQKGITYISYSNNDKPAVLFKDSYMIDNPSSKKRVDDPVIDCLPPEKETCYSYQKDSKFGGNVYTLDYQASDSEIFLDINNYSALKYMGFKCVDEESLSLCVDAYLTSEGIVVSGLATVTGQGYKVKAVVVTVDLPSAFMKRLTSLKNWFVETV